LTTEDAIAAGVFFCNSAVDIIQLWAIEFIGICALLRQRPSRRTGERSVHMFITPKCDSHWLRPTRYIRLIYIYPAYCRCHPSTDHRLQNNNCHISDTIL